MTEPWDKAWRGDANDYGSSLYDLTYIQEHRKRQEHTRGFWSGLGKIMFWTGVILAAVAIYPW